MNTGNVTHRLHEFIKAQNLAVSTFEREIGVGSSVISKAIKNNSEFGFSVLSKIAEKYPNFNLEWLITGRGAMLHGALKDANFESSNESFQDYKDKYLQLLEKFNEYLQNHSGASHSRQMLHTIKEMKG